MKVGEISAMRYRTWWSAGLAAALVAAGSVWLRAGNDSRLAQPPPSELPRSQAASSTSATAPVQVPLLWDATGEPGLAEYVVSWGDRPATYTASRTVSANDTAVVLELVRRADPYFIVVQAKDAAGRLSGFSNEFAVDVSSGRARPWKPAVRKKPAREKQHKPPKPPKAKRQR